MKILLIEDDKNTAEAVKNGLKSHYYTVDSVFTGGEGEINAEVNDYDLVIIDIMLPDIDGIEVCRRIRSSGIKTPILMLTARLSVEDKVTALDNGADDYLTKPFNLAELLARVRALMRRDVNSLKNNKLKAADLILDTTTYMVKRTDKTIDLRKKELEILEYLMRNKGKVMSRSMIFEHVWDENSNPFTNVVDVHIRYLREKIDLPFREQLIKTVHGIGYKIEG